MEFKIRISARFKLTRQSLEKLKSELPEDVLTELSSIQNQNITGKEKFLDILKSTIGDGQTARFKSVILEHAKTIHSAQAKFVQDTSPAQSVDLAPLLERLSEIEERIEGLIRQETTDHEPIKQFGEDLYNAVFNKGIKILFAQALSQANPNKDVLRIRLLLEEELQGIPWELLYDTERNHFLAPFRGISMVRSTDNNPAQPLQIRRPLRILVAAATPLDYAPLDARREIDILVETLSILIQQRDVEIYFIHGPNTMGQLATMLTLLDFHVFYFIGHGEDEGGRLIMEAENRMSQPVSGAQIYATFGANHRFQLVILNACKGARRPHKRADGPQPLYKSFDSVAKSLTEAGIPAVIAMQHDITDDAAKRLARNIFEGLLQGLTIDGALTRFRVDVFATSNSIEWCNPLLYLKNFGGTLFTFAAGLAQNPFPQPFNHFAEKARDNARWSEVIDYCQEALILNPNDQGILDLLGAAKRKEFLSLKLHEARFLERFDDGWAAAAKEYAEYLIKVQDDAHVRTLKMAAELGMGTKDPSLKWRQF